MLTKYIIYLFLTSGTKGVDLFRRFFQSNPLKKGCFFISSAPLFPSLFSGTLINFRIKLSALDDKLASFGILKFFFQCTIFLQVSEGLSVKKGGYPT